MALPGIELRFLGPAAYSLFALSTEHPRLIPRASTMKRFRRDLSEAPRWHAN
jgi:hypothetical protein